MPDRDPAGFSRVCPACGRRVPRNVATCRCGVELPLEVLSDAPAVEPAATGGGSTAIVALVTAGLLAAGAGYWFFPRAGAVTTPGSPARGDAASRASNPTRAGASPEARAWDAAAHATDAAASAAAPIAPSSATDSPVKLSASIEEMVDRVMPAVVLIETTGGRGSGFYVRHDTLITNAHVVQNDTYVTLRRMDGSSVSARVETKSPALDLAILKVATPSSSQAVIPMAAQGVRPGQEIIVIGSALGTLQNSVSRGIVSGLRTAGGATLVQTDAASNPGNSGGPMLNRDGAVIGITTMGYKNAEGLNFGVAIEHARDLLEGRTARLGTTGGLNDVQSRSQDSTSDRRQQQGEEQFRGGVNQLAQSADTIDRDWKAFRDRCFKNPIPGNYQREWFAVLVPRKIPSDAAAGCISYYQGLESNIKEFHGMMRRLLTEARRANLLPGTIRDALRHSRLEFDWDR